MRLLKRSKLLIRAPFNFVCAIFSPYAHPDLFLQVSDKGLVLSSDPIPPSVMHSLLVAAYDMMQHEIEHFLRVCLFEMEKSSDNADTNAGISSHGRCGFFSLGVANDWNKTDSGYGSLVAS
jgi:hypothetical protein